MANVLSILPSQQIEDGYCLPACARMALAYLGIFRSQQEIARALKTRKGFDTPASSIINLRSQHIEILYRVGGVLNDIQFCLQNSYPVIAFVQAGELPHWHGTRAQHAILIVGLDEREIFLHDPAIADSPIATPTGDFRLAWDELDNRYAVITKQK